MIESFTSRMSARMSPGCEMIGGAMGTGDEALTRPTAGDELVYGPTPDQFMARQRVEPARMNEQAKAASLTSIAVGPKTRAPRAEEPRRPQPRRNPEPKAEMQSTLQWLMHRSPKVWN